MNLSHTPSRSRQKRTSYPPEMNKSATALETAQESIDVRGVYPKVAKEVRLEQSLLASQRRIRELEKERDRLTCDLHDGVLQSLYAVGLGLESCGRLLQSAPLQVREQLTRSAAQLDQALRELRSILKPDSKSDIVGVEDLGKELRALMESMTGLSSIHGRLTIDPAAIVSIPKGQRRDILHFVREALSNCVRHAQATEVAVSLMMKNGIPWLQINDNGVGFSAHHPPKTGLGLHSLTARASSLGARLDIVSQPSHGTRLSLELPGR